MYAGHADISLHCTSVKCTASRLSQVYAFTTAIDLTKLAWCPLPAGMPDKCMTSFLRVGPSLVGSKRSGRVMCLVNGEAPNPPNPGCMVCSKAPMHLTVNTEAMTLQQLVDKASAAAAAAAAPAALASMFGVVCLFKQL
jgi:hypothetical protein